MHWIVISPATLCGGSDLPAGRTSRMTSRSSVLNSAVVRSSANAAPRGRTSITWPERACGMAILDPRFAVQEAGSRLRAGPRMLSARSSACEQGFVHAPVGAVAAAGGGLHGGAVQYRDFAAVIADQLALLQRVRRTGHSHAPNAEHVRQHFVRDVKLAAVRAILRHQ